MHRVTTPKRWVARAPDPVADGRPPAHKLLLHHTKVVLPCDHGASQAKLDGRRCRQIPFVYIERRKELQGELDVLLSGRPPTTSSGEAAAATVSLSRLAGP
ncbi:hypothetical protein L1987_33136 [Smallanthus sonchifolius]|uniref:Uncharacterized protein n=1 Tax=Smallanthus sonchifolius TaxID=185202 RepID=A0ACB9HPY5_9ASTR|nr:hypothetical protein L1987_33136 [Smallanthus sonchifolius]